MVNYLLNSDEQKEITGTWHRDGYHGHYRAKSRIEFSTLYRQNAKPKPPQKFVVRITNDASKHSFSNHDNKQVFLNDPMLFGSGVGKKKIDSVNRSRWNPKFMAWEDTPNENNYFNRSIYQKDFCPSVNTTKLLTGRKNVETRPISVYTYAHTHGEPTADTSKQAQLETYYRYISKNRAKSHASIERNNVASCLVWHDCIRPRNKQNETVQACSINTTNNDNYNNNTYTDQRPKTAVSFASLNSAPLTSDSTTTD